MPKIELFKPLFKEDSAPLYLQLQKVLRDAIHNNVFGVEDAIPPERILSQQLEVSRITVRKAIAVSYTHLDVYKRQPYYSQPDYIATIYSSLSISVTGDKKV